MAFGFANPAAGASTKAQVSPGSRKRMRADSERAEDCPIGCKRQRNDDGEMIMQCCTASLTTSKRKRSDPDSDDEVAAQFKRLKIGGHQQPRVSRRRVTSSWASLDEGMNWAVNWGRHTGTWDFDRLK